MAALRGRFFRDNAFLIAAGLLPFVVVVFFIISTAIPRWTVPPPNYDLVIRAERWYDSPAATAQTIVDYRVENGRIEATVRPAPANTYRPPAALFLFDHQTMTAREIPVALPKNPTETDPPQTVVVDALAGRRVVADARAPDGYAFENRDRRGPGLVGDVFGIGRYESTAALVNGGRVIPIELPMQFRYPSTISAVGWVIDSPQR
jgi:hypothetical protein